MRSPGDLREPFPSWSLLREWFDGERVSAARRDAGLWVVETLEGHLGESWADRVFRSQDSLQGLLAAAPFHSHAFAQLLEMATRLESISNMPGRATLRRDLKADLTIDRWFHTETMLEVATLAADLNLNSAVEVGSTHSPIDVVVSWTDHAMPIEVTTLFRDAKAREADAAIDRFSSQALQMSLAGELSLAVELVRVPSMREFEVVVLDLAASARRSNGAARRSARFGSISLDLRQGFMPPRISGPPTRSGGWRRTGSRLLQKADKPNATQPLWLRVDVRDGLWQFTGWSELDLSSKIEILALQIQQDLADSDHVVGVVLSSGSVRADGAFGDETAVAANGRGIGLRRLLPMGRIRETMIVPLATRPIEVEVWRSIYDSEPRWLAAALKRLGLPDIDTF